MKTQKTKSVCPKCGGVVDAEIVPQGNVVVLKKRCDKHGEFEEIIYDRAQFEDVMGYMKYVPESGDVPGCPYTCEGCTGHLSKTILAIMNLTNRCNLSCSYCFANAARSGYLYEPSLEQIKAMLSYIRGKEPVCTSILLSGVSPQ